MANIQKRADGKWRARYRDGSGKEHCKHFARKVDAQRWATEQESSVNRGVHVDPRAGRVTVREFGERWRTGQLQHRESTGDAVERIMRLHVYPYIGDRRIAAVARTDVQALVNLWSSGIAAQTGEPAAPRTVRQRYAFLSAMFRAAADDDVIAKSPCTRAKLPEIVREQIHPLTRNQVHVLIAATVREIRPVVVTGAGLGTRVSEALGVTQDRIRFLRREVMIDRQQSPKPPYPLVPLKNSRSTPHRVVPAPAFLLEELGRLEVCGEESRMFTRPGGRPIIARDVAHAVADAVASAGLPPGTTFHDLRHFYASTLIAGGESVVVVAARLGDTVTQTLSTYSHLWPDDAERTRTIMDGVFAEDHADYARTAISAVNRE